VTIAQAHPSARHEGLVVRALSDELLVYDLERHHAHCLNSTAAAVWRAADGGTLEDIRTRAGRQLGLGLSEEIVLLALEQLDGIHLLDAPLPRDRGLDRSQLLRRAALVAGAVALPTTTSLVAPTTASAQSCLPCFSPCSPQSGPPCCSGCSCQTFEGSFCAPQP
jgi:hypothetical protein